MQRSPCWRAAEANSAGRFAFADRSKDIEVTARIHRHEELAAKTTAQSPHNARLHKPDERERDLQMLATLERAALKAGMQSQRGDVDQPDGQRLAAGARRARGKIDGLAGGLPPLRLPVLPELFRCFRHAVLSQWPVEEEGSTVLVDELFPEWRFF